MGERRPQGAQRGETLIEVVLAVAIIGTAVVGLVGALGASFRFAAASRVDVDGELLLARYAEALVAVRYEACQAGVVPYLGAAASAIPSAGLPAGLSAGPWGSGATFELTVESTTYWNGDRAPATFATTCGASDRGSEMLHLRVRSSDGAFDRRLSIVKRRP